MAHEEKLSREAATAARAIREPPRPKPKRIYKSVFIDGPPFRVLLDSKPLATPLRRPVITRTRAMAEAVAAEWDAQITEIDPATMPVMRLVATCIDKVITGRTELIDTLLAHADTDLLCYHAASPADLKARQAAAWRPVLDWVGARIGATFAAGEGLMPFAQSEATKAALKSTFEALDDWRFTAAQAVAGISGSLVLALAMTERRLSAAETCALALLDETYQQERWGQDALATARRDAIAYDLAGVEAFLALL